MEIRPQTALFQQLDPVASSPGAKATVVSATVNGPQADPDVTSLSSGQMLSGDDVRTDRVQALQSQIADGTYQVSAQDVASKIFDSMLQ